jgi:hypothetical protein
MTIVKKNSLRRKTEIDLTGPDGNAWAMMGYARTFAKQLGKDDKTIIDEMMSGNYENLVNVFDREFGEYVDLIL